MTATPVTSEAADGRPHERSHERPDGASVAQWAHSEGRPSLLAPSMRRRIIDLLVQAGTDADGQPVGRSAPDVAAALGLHVTTARHHLEILVDAHVVEAASERTGQVGRPRKVYRLVPSRLRLDPIHRELSALVTSMWGRPEPEGSRATEPAARAWAQEHAETEPAAWAPATTAGQWLRTAERVVEVMEPWGFRHDIVLVDGGRQVDLVLTDAPFLAIAARHAPVLHAFRRGLVLGVLDRLGETHVEVTLTSHTDLAKTTTHLVTATPLRHTVRTTAARAPHGTPTRRSDA